VDRERLDHQILLARLSSTAGADRNIDWPTHRHHCYATVVSMVSLSTKAQAESEDHCLPPGTPEPVRLLGRFANTLDLRSFGPYANRPLESRDHLLTPHALAAWLTQHDLARAPLAVSPHELRQVRDLRGAIRGSLGAAGQTRTWTADTGIRASLTPGEPLHLSPRSTGVNAAIARILLTMYEAQTAGLLARLKTCHATDCQWVFYDTGRNRAGRWCGMTSCGNRTKTRRYRQRQRQAP
jgi:predicted RNA-binding Zn ribbon-like protein